MTKKKDPDDLIKPGPKEGNRILNHPETKDLICQWIEKALLTRRECADRLGVEPSVLTVEMKKDPTFAQRVREAERAPHDMLVESMIGHARLKDWRACWTLLSAKWGSKWNRKDGYFSPEDMTAFCLNVSELVHKYVPEESQFNQLE